MLLLWFIVLSSSVDRTQYRKSSESPFCQRGLNAKESQWYIPADSIVDQGDVFKATIVDQLFNTKLSLYIKYLTIGTFHIKIVPSIKELFDRFDVSEEPTVVNQEVKNDLGPYKYAQNNDEVTLSGSEETLVIQLKPFLITLKDKAGDVVIINPDNRAVFETNRDKEKNPELFESNTYNGFNDVFKNGPTSVAMTFRFVGEKVRLQGLPLHTLPLTLPDTTDEPIRLYNTDINRFEIGNGMSMYGSIPFLLAKSVGKTASLFWANPSETWVTVKSGDGTAETRFISEGGYLDMYLSTGDHKSVIERYTSLTGKPMLTPRFALGYHQCRWGYYSQADLMDVSKKLDDYKIPHDVLWLDLDHTDNRRYFTWHPKNFPTPLKMLDSFWKDKRYVVVLCDPHLIADKGYHVYKEFSELGLVLMRNGNEYNAECWPGKSAWPDYFNPAARKLWEKHFSFSKFKLSRENLYFWNDMNEMSVFDAADKTSHKDIVIHNGIEEREVHNMHGHMMISSTFGGLIKRTEKPKRPFILTRSFFAGSQKYSYIWTGDNSAEYSHLKNSIPSVLSAGLAGIPFSGADVGGFFDSPSESLLARWFSVAAWIYPFFREHCHHNSEWREPNVVKNDDYRRLIINSVHERYQHLPYWYTLAHESNQTGHPIVRPLWWCFDSPEYFDVDDKVMLGDGILVVPHINEEDNPLKVSLPPNNRWYDLRTLKEIKNTVDEPPLEFGRAAVYLRGGYIIPTKDTTRKSSTFMFKDPFTLTVGLSDDQTAFGSLYEDDGESFEYSDGVFINKLISFSNGVLESKDAGNPPKGLFASSSYKVTVNCIKVVGLKSKPTTITGPKGNLDFYYEDEVLIIRKPNLLISENWKVTFE